MTINELTEQYILRALQGARQTTETVEERYAIDRETGEEILTSKVVRTVTAPIPVPASLLTRLTQTSQEPEPEALEIIYVEGQDHGNE